MQDSAGKRSISSAQSGESGPLLSVQGVSVRFGGITALSDVSFDVGELEICGIIGPNGAGKTTLFNCLADDLPPLVQQNPEVIRAYLGAPVS